MTTSRVVRRLYATEATKTQPSKFKKPLLSLESFIERQKVIKFWREIVRATNKIKMQDTRREMRDFARAEFDRHRHVADLQQVKYLVSIGRDQFKMMQRYVDEMGRR